MTVAITGFGYVDKAGMHGGRGTYRWDEMEISGFNKLRWKQFSDQPFDRYARLDPLSKCAIAATEMMGMDVPAEDNLQPRGAVVLGTQSGCVNVDINFCESIHQIGGASPRLFAYTLPSSAVGEIAIRYRMTGDNLCVMAEDESYFAAVYEAYQLVVSGEVDQCICVVADAINDKARDFSQPAAGMQHHYAFAIMLKNIETAEDAGENTLATLQLDIDHANANAQPTEIIQILVKCLGDKTGCKHNTVIDSQHAGKIRVNCQTT